LRTKAVVEELNRKGANFSGQDALNCVEWLRIHTLLGSFYIEPCFAELCSSFATVMIYASNLQH